MYYLHYLRFRWIIAGLVVATSLIYGQAASSTAPTFYLTDLSGNDFFASRVYGDNAKEPSAVVLSFFATWCIPCRAEVPQLEILSKTFPEIQFYLVSVKDQEDMILKWLNDLKVELPVLVDKYGKTAKKFNVIGESDTGQEVASLPSLFIIDKTGAIIYQHTGYKVGDEIALKKILETLD
ncbi:MAG: TlpA family protein disulfide reductase [Candidatus Marinimicrobia bacterium]|jgi:peroxiredoxin|nr:TlpA family protein disulfide reductase [Candidatus Neomarinimicrobiota bacterium]MBT4361765.1 TlpA family protein disulfide reductase [Candidatus Neomarinimicrobiota bacterium]MBT4994654.1 TlpA family protein disulfide reductase [Candidatus Neomarinimicrobiota bacterium]MBT5313766.1 TlpA family protein disulfide reductase [Candidatus Neomarinimicrobiota bacterium]MBT7579065.1 TlpA family protein disulfide reductase [Candidatus Neomarinimicrobiota bacterium]